MRSMTKIVSTLALTFAFGIAEAQTPGTPGTGPIPLGLAWQPPVQKKSALEDALEQALKNNPDLRVAASKLALAEAELNRTRLEVTQKVATAYAETLAERAVVAEMERQLARVQQLHKNGSAPAEEMSKANLQLTERKTKLANAQRALEHLQGKVSVEGKLSFTSSARFFAGGNQSLRGFDFQPPLLSNFALEQAKVTVHPPKTPATDKLRESLTKTVKLTGTKITLSDYLALVKQGTNVKIQADTRGDAWKETVEVSFENVTLAGALQFLEDSLPGHQIVVREYGLLIAPDGKVPPGAMTMTAFLASSFEKETPKSNLSGERIEGKITKVDDKGLYAISIGQKAGLAKGHHLEVYRSAPVPKYLGKITVIEVTADSAVCKNDVRMHGNPGEGDLVATRIGK